MTFSMKCATRTCWGTLALVAIALSPMSASAKDTDSELTREQVQSAMHQAVGFFRQHASASGGYVYQLSADLSKREGEGKVGTTTAWVQPPGTPAVGMAYLDAYRYCGDPLLLTAARETAEALLRGQLKSGAWDYRIEFEPSDRKKYAYRVDTDSTDRRRNTSTFDDDKSQSAIRFLMQLDQETKFNDAPLHEAVLYALDSVLKSQYANGAWPQRFSEFPKRQDAAVQKASIPKQWSRTYPGKKYSGFYTLNDNTISDLITTLIDAWDIYGDARYLQSAMQGGDFLLLAQLPEPQPGWAQQYDQAMHPAWARKFEPPSITGGESQQVMRTLMLLYRRTATSSKDADRFLEPLPRAIAYYRRSQLDDGRLARFYEMKTNRPLYFTKEYELTYSSADMPTHYTFIVDSRIDRLEKELNEIKGTKPDQLWHPPSRRPARRSAKLDAKVSKIIGAIDSRGAWVESGKLSYHGSNDPTRKLIRSTTFAKNLRTLAQWLGAK